MSSQSISAGCDCDDPVIMRRLLIEATTSPFNNAYRKSFIRALATFVYLYVASRRCKHDSDSALAGDVLCYGFFPNELHAIDTAIRSNPAWRKVALDFRHLEGLDWRSVFDPAPKLLLRFLRAAWKSGGWSATRDFVYPFIGYLLLQRFRELFGRSPTRPVVVTTNLVHPVSVGIHLAASRAGLRTIFWEHAMTPRMIAEDMGYSEYHVHCSHTVQSFLANGVSRSRLCLIGDDPEPIPAPLGDPTSLVRIGVCINDMDSMDSVEQVVDLLSRLRRNAVLRVHDSDRRYTVFARLAKKYGISLSSAARSRIGEFLREVDVVIAGNSNVVLDCLRAGMRVIYFWQGDPVLFDYYGIVAATGCNSSRSITELAARLNEPAARWSVPVQ